MEEVKLTDKEELFCKEFIKDLNRTQAAIRAKYSKASAATIGSELLRKPHIRARVQELQKERSDALMIESSFVLKQLIELASVSAGDLFKPDGNMKDWGDLTDEEKKAIEEIRITEKEYNGNVTTKRVYKLLDRHTTLEMLSKHIGFYERDNKQKTPGYDLSNLSDEQLQFLLTLPRKE